MPQAEFRDALLAGAALAGQARAAVRRPRATAPRLLAAGRLARPVVARKAVTAGSVVPTALRARSATTGDGFARSAFHAKASGATESSARAGGALRRAIVIRVEGVGNRRVGWIRLLASRQYGQGGEDRKEGYWQVPLLHERLPQQTPPVVPHCAPFPPQLVAA